MKKTTISLAFISILLGGCSTTKDWSATGGSKADGVIRLSYEFGQFELPQVSEEQAILLAARRCAVWGYTSEIPSFLETQIIPSVRVYKRCCFR